MDRGMSFNLGYRGMSIDIEESVFQFEDEEDTGVGYHRPNHDKTGECAHRSFLERVLGRTLESSSPSRPPPPVFSPPPPPGSSSPLRGSQGSLPGGARVLAPKSATRGAPEYLDMRNSSSPYGNVDAVGYAPHDAPPGLAAPEIYWQYLDPQLQSQGPFSALEMLTWSEKGYFSSELPLRRVDDPNMPFVALHLLFPPPLIPFQSEMVPWQEATRSSSAHNMEASWQEAHRSNAHNMTYETEMMRMQMQQMVMQSLKPKLYREHVAYDPEPHEPENEASLDQDALRREPAPKRAGRRPVVREPAPRLDAAFREPAPAPAPVSKAPPKASQMTASLKHMLGIQADAPALPRQAPPSDRPRVAAEPREPDNKGKGKAHAAPKIEAKPKQPPTMDSFPAMGPNAAEKGRLCGRKTGVERPKNMTREELLLHIARKYSVSVELPVLEWLSTQSASEVQEYVASALGIFPNIARFSDELSNVDAQLADMQRDEEEKQQPPIQGSPTSQPKSKKRSKGKKIDPNLLGFNVESLRGHGVIDRP